MASLLSPAAIPTKLSPLPSTNLSVSPISLRFSVLKLPTTIRSHKPTRAVAPATTTVSTDSDEKSAIPVPVNTKKVLVPIGFGTEEMEAVILVDVLRRAGAEVRVASVEKELEVEACGGTKLVADTSISSCADEVYDLVALPGGMPGSARLRDCETLRKITKKQAEEGKLYGAICAAPAVTLLPWGLLKSKKTTGHPAFMDRLPTFRAVKSKVSVSHGLTTSRGPGTSYDFALSFVDQLFGESVAEEVGRSLLFHIADGDLRKEEFNKVEWLIGLKPSALIPVANGSEAIEVVTIADILRRAKVDVTIASVEKSLQIVASQGEKIVADKFLKNAEDSVFDLIILPGGADGTEKLQKSRFLKKLLKEQESSGRVYGAISSAPAILHKYGLLKDKRFTAHPSIASQITDEAINGTKVVVDGKLITSQGLATATDLGLTIVSKFFGHSRARSVAEGIVYLEFSKWQK